MKDVVPLKPKAEISNTKAALGFRAHSGWAVLVVLAGPVDCPMVVERRRIEIADPKMAGSKQPYHAAQNMKLKDAEALVSVCTEASVRLAMEAVQSAINDARQKGYEVLTSGIVAGSGRAIPGLEKILGSHPLLHTAEGELFRDVIVRACGSRGLSVVAVREKELMSRLEGGSGIGGELIEQHLARMGRLVGAPWRQDEKFACVAGWIARLAV